jgi:hypothetical protein
MKRHENWMMVILLLTGAVVFTLPAIGAATDSDIAPGKIELPKMDAAEKVAIPEGLQTAELAYQLVEYARKNESAETMLAAVQMLKRVSLNPSAMDTGEDTVLPEEQTAKKKGIPPSTDTEPLINEALVWARESGQPELVAMLEAEAQRKPLSIATLGPIQDSIFLQDQVVKAMDGDIYTTNFRGGEGAAVLVIGDGDTDLDLFVYDANNRLVVSDISASGHCYVAWLPRLTATYHVVVSNILGSVYNKYQIMMATPAEVLTVLSLATGN